MPAAKKTDVRIPSRSPTRAATKIAGPGEAAATRCRKYAVIKAAIMAAPLFFGHIGGVDGFHADHVIPCVDVQVLACDATAQIRQQI